MGGKYKEIEMRDLNWDSFNRFFIVQEMYLPRRGQGKTMGTQAVTAISKLVYNWFAYGDVYHNEFIGGVRHDLTSYAEWLYWNIFEARKELSKVFDSSITEEEYTEILYNVFEIVESMVKDLKERPKKDSIYKNNEYRMFFFS